jgi:hypothetical protein
MEAGVNWLLELGEATTAVTYQYNRRQCSVSLPKPHKAKQTKSGQLARGE